LDIEQLVEDAGKLQTSTPLSVVPREQDRSADLSL